MDEAAVGKLQRGVQFVLTQMRVALGTADETRLFEFLEWELTDGTLLKLLPATGPYTLTHVAMEVVEELKEFETIGIVDGPAVSGTSEAEVSHLQFFPAHPAQVDHRN
jgi:hypothetical protein